MVTPYVNQLGFYHTVPGRETGKTSEQTAFAFSACLRLDSSRLNLRATSAIEAILPLTA